METLIIKIDTAEHAKQVTTLLKKTKGVKSIVKSPKKYNWKDPLRPATEKEIQEMIVACEDTPLLSVAEAKANTYSKIEQWKKKKK